MTLPARSRCVVLAARPQGAPKPTDFKLEHRPISEPRADELLVKTRWLSLDPYMRRRMDDRKSYSAPLLLGGIMGGEVIAEVIKSNHSDYEVGNLLIGRLGWQTHAISNGAELVRLDARYTPITTALGVLGMPGLIR